MFTASDYKELPVWSHAHDGNAPYRDFAFFKGREDHPMRLGSDQFQPVNAWWLMELCLLAYTGEEHTTSELARISQVTRQTMHASILSLEAAGLVERRARNQRVVLVRPAPVGGYRGEPPPNPTPALGRREVRATP